VDLPAHTRERIAELRALHKPPGIKLTRRGRFAWIRNLRVDRHCKMCGQRWPCRQLRWAADVEAGRVAPAGWRNR
jgi:hypothetical protein